MVEKTIKTIKETEKVAEEILKNSEKTCTEILEKATAQAEELKQKTVAEAKNKAQAAMGTAAEDGDKSLSISSDRINVEIDELKKAASAKEDEAIRAVIAALV